MDLQFEIIDFEYCDEISCLIIKCKNEFFHTEAPNYKHPSDPIITVKVKQGATWLGDIFYSMTR